MACCHGEAAPRGTIRSVGGVPSGWCVSECGGPRTTVAHLGSDLALVEIVHDDLQCGEEGFKIEVHGHVSFGERYDMAEDSRRTFSSGPAY